MRIATPPTAMRTNAPAMRVQCACTAHQMRLHNARRWVEEYARRLAAGWYGGCTADASLAGSDIPTDGAISLYPRAFPAAATAITRGVQVRGRRIRCLYAA